MLQSRRVAPQSTASPAENKFSVLRRVGRVWAVAAIHGEVERLAAIHDALEARFSESDRVVYLGNYAGHGPAIRATVDELLRFRRAIIGRPRMFSSDIVYLRGSQEEMWHKLLQLQFAVNPLEVLEWMLSQGAEATIRAYGGDPARGRAAMRAGAVAIGRWTGALRQAMTAQPGHRELMSALRRAAYTEDERLLFVHAGLDPRRPLDEQGDALWWGHLAWSKLKAPYGSFRCVVRGYGPGDSGDPGPHALTLDAGCGFGGPLVAVCLDAADGQVIERFEA
jgi:serine/threonine protein phosphatase 1